MGASADEQVYVEASKVPGLTQALREVEHEHGIVRAKLEAEVVRLRRELERVEAENAKLRDDLRHARASLRSIGAGPARDPDELLDQF